MFRCWSGNSSSTPCHTCNRGPRWLCRLVAVASVVVAAVWLVPDRQPGPGAGGVSAAVGVRNGDLWAGDEETAQWASAISRKSVEFDPKFGSE